MIKKILGLVLLLGFTNISAQNDSTKTYSDSLFQNITRYIEAEYNIVEEPSQNGNPFFQSNIFLGDMHLKPNQYSLKQAYYKSKTGVYVEDYNGTMYKYVTLVYYYFNDTGSTTEYVRNYLGSYELHLSEEILNEGVVEGVQSPPFLIFRDSNFFILIKTRCEDHYDFPWNDYNEKLLDKLELKQSTKVYRCGCGGPAELLEL